MIDGCRCVGCGTRIMSTMKVQFLRISNCGENHRYDTISGFHSSFSSKLSSSSCRMYCGECFVNDQESTFEIWSNQQRVTRRQRMKRHANNWWNSSCQSSINTSTILVVNRTTEKRFGGRNSFWSFCLRQVDTWAIIWEIFFCSSNWSIRSTYFFKWCCCLICWINRFGTWVWQYWSISTKEKDGIFIVDISPKWLSGKCSIFYRSRSLICLTFSDFQIREANALPIAHTYTVMCVLPINLFNQVRIDRYGSSWRRSRWFSLANIHVSLVLVCHCHSMHCVRFAHLDLSIILSTRWIPTRTYESSSERLRTTVAIQRPL